MQRPASTLIPLKTELICTATKAKEAWVTVAPASQEKEELCWAMEATETRWGKMILT